MGPHADIGRENKDGSADGSFHHYPVLVLMDLTLIDLAEEEL